MVEERTFLANIASNPDDDFPRLVFADWLEEQGDPWGQVIRWQCEAARYQPPDANSTPDLRWLALNSLANEALKKLIREGRFHSITELGGHFGRDSFRRGMPEKLSVNANKLAEIGQELAHVTPTLRAIKLRLTPGFPLKELHQCPALHQIDELDLTITSQQTKWDVDALSRSPWLAGIEHLKLKDQIPANPLGNMLGQIGLAVIDLLCSSGLCERLSSLNLSENDLGAHGLRKLDQRCAFAKLKRWDLTRNEIFSSGVEVLADSQQWRFLTHLDLGLNCPMFNDRRNGENAGPILATLLRLKDLVHLNLRSCGLPYHGGGGSLPLHDFWESPGEHLLTSLDLRKNNLTVEDLCGMIGRPTTKGQFPHLARVDLAENEITGREFRVISASEGFRKLKWLSLGQNRIFKIQRSQFPPVPENCTLEWLDLSTNSIRSDTASELARTPFLCGLQYLDLADNEITDDGIVAIAKSPVAANLEVLSLSHNPFGSRGIRALIDSPMLNTLRFLFLDGVPVTESQLSALRERYGRFVFCAPLV